MACGIWHKNVAKQYKTTKKRMRNAGKNIDEKCDLCIAVKIH